MTQSLNRISAIFLKECKDARKCPPVMIAFFMMPLMSMIFHSFLPHIDAVMLLTMFYPMHIIISGLLSCSAIMAEEKEKYSLRVLMMNMVRPSEYIIGIGIFVFLGQLLGTFIFFFITELPLQMLIPYLLLSFAGNLCSILLGSLIGVIVKNQLSVAPLAVPVMLTLTFIPMFAAFNPVFQQIARFIFTYQISQQILRLTENNSLQSPGLLTILTNLIVLFLLFIYAFNRNQLDT